MLYAVHLDSIGSEEVAEEHPILVHGLCFESGNAPVSYELIVARSSVVAAHRCAVQPKHRVAVADIKH